MASVDRRGSVGFAIAASPHPCVATFRSIIKNVPQPVVIVTTAWTDDETGKVVKRGITCSSFNSISTDPPIASFCIRFPSRIDKLLRRSNKFAINMLAHEQVGLCLYFAKAAKEEKCQFADVPHSMKNGLPVLKEVPAVLLCRTIKVDTIGDHNVWYGEMVHGDVLEAGESSPLLYYNRSFRSIGDEVFIRAFETLTLKFEEWTHEAHLRMAWNYIRQLGVAEARPLIKQGIQKYNQKHQERISRGYNETVTEFYIQMIARAVEDFNPPNLSFDDFLKEKKYLADPALLFEYYNMETISSTEAQTRFLPPDLKPMPTKD